MIQRINKITIFKTRRPAADNVNEELQWVCDSLGIFGDRDKHKNYFTIFIFLLRSLHHADGMTSDELSEKVGLSRGTVVHHLHKLMGSGLVVSQRNRYMLRVNNLTSLIDEVERDIIRTMDDLKKVAGEIDRRLEL